MAKRGRKVDVALFNERLAFVKDIANANEGIATVKECVCVELNIADFLVTDREDRETVNSYVRWRMFFSNLIVAGKAVQHEGYTSKIRLLLEAKRLSALR